MPYAISYAAFFAIQKTLRYVTLFSQARNNYLHDANNCALRIRVKTHTGLVKAISVT